MGVGFKKKKILIGLKLKKLKTHSDLSSHQVPGLTAPQRTDILSEALPPALIRHAGTVLTRLRFSHGELKGKLTEREPEDSLARAESCAKETGVPGKAARREMSLYFHYVTDF